MLYETRIFKPAIFKGSLIEYKVKDFMETNGILDYDLVYNTLTGSVTHVKVFDKLFDTNDVISVLPNSVRIKGSAYRYRIPGFGEFKACMPYHNRGVFSNNSKHKLIVSSDNMDLFFNLSLMV